MQGLGTRLALALVRVASWSTSRSRGLIIPRACARGKVICRRRRQHKIARSGDLVASNPGSLSGGGEGKESLVHTVCACAKIPRNPGNSYFCPFIYP